MIQLLLYLAQLAYYLAALAVIVRYKLFGDRMADKTEPPKKRQWALDTDLAAMAEIDAIMTRLSEKDRGNVLEWINRKHGSTTRPETV